ncbi:nuclease-related domain-containing protein [Vibrio sp. WXL210]|uniref:nuclease-related domain-containing protein n=1 Tax=Vibrio sp. WXL210 TaxID=3450709 RepID=UPI003EC5DCCB
MKLKQKLIQILKLEQKLKQELGPWLELVKTKKEVELGHVQAGRDAEDLFQGMVERQMTFNRGTIYSGKRIPNPNGGRFEIDAIILTHSRIHLVEVKNWSGILHACEGGWKQTKRSGEVIEHRDILELNKEKLAAFRQYLESQDVELPSYLDELFTFKTIFMNDKLRIDPIIQQDEDVVCRSTLDAYLRDSTTSLRERMLSAIVEVLASRDAEIINAGLTSQMLSSQQQSIAQCLEKLRTWDEVELFGGRIISGDALKLVLESQPYDLKDKQGGEGFRLRWVRNRIWSLLLAKRGKSLGKIKLAKGKLDVSPLADNYVLFHAAGDPKPTKIPLKQVEAFVKG